ncbi:MAG: transcriptional regulator FilR1 domain-containing protein [Haloarculaceae archaeon]
MSESDADPLAEIEFLARSPNRIGVLAALVEGSHTRRELEERLEVSQPTLGRILGDLAERNWVESEEGHYRATPTGELVEAGITDLRERLETETRLREIVEWLSMDALAFDFRHLGDATITTPTRTRPNAPIQRMLDLLEATDSVSLLSHAFNEQKLDLVHDRTAAGELTTRGVFAETAIDAVVAAPSLRRKLRDILASESAEIRVTDAEVPLAVEITDDRVHLLLRDEEGIVRASLDTDDETVRSWAEDIHERYWADARPLDPVDVQW